MSYAERYGEYGSRSALLYRAAVNLCATSSLILLCLFAVVSSVDWLPGTTPGVFYDSKHVLIFSYLATRALYHLLTGEATLPKTRITLLPAVVSVALLAGLNPGINPGIVTRYILSVVFGYMVLFHFCDQAFDTSNVSVLVRLYVFAVLVQATYIILVSLTLLPAFGQPASVWGGSEPQVALGFMTGPGNLTSIISFGLTLALGLYVFGDRRHTIWLPTILTLLTVLLYVVFVAFGGAGRQGLLAVGFALGIVLLYRLSLQRLLPVLPILPVFAYDVIFLASRLFPITDILLPLNAFLSRRLALADSAVRIILHHPLGVGYGNFPHHFLMPPWDLNAFPGMIPDGPHNLFLLIATAAGVLPALVLCYWIVSVFRYLAANAATDTALTKALALGLTTRVLVAVSVGGWAMFDMYKASIWWILLAGYVAHHTTLEQ